mmetsp:Transcript_11501/g.27955  ORF Transcript_11501/g.27955 Transcript_11501/m.27955 type:complete len:213 (-) Transcript_11501:76-714(-)
MGTFVLAAHGTSAAVCCNGQLYSWGCGGDAHLDQAHRIHNQTTSRPDDDGTGTRTGAWGGRGNRLGHGEDKGTKDVPTLVRGAMCGRRVMCVSGGAYVTAAVTSDGHLFTWGQGEDGTLGLGRDLSDRNVPTLVHGALRGKRVVAVSASGDTHAVALTSEGEVFSWGRGRDLQLGHGNDDDKHHPTLVGGCLLGKKVVAVSVHSDYSAAVKP